MHALCCTGVTLVSYSYVRFDVPYYFGRFVYVIVVVPDEIQESKILSVKMYFIEGLI